MPELSKGPPVEKTGRGSLLNRPSCPYNDPIGQGSELNWADHSPTVWHAVTTQLGSHSRGFRGTNHPTAPANRKVTSNIPLEKPEEWSPCLAYKLHISTTRKTASFRAKRWKSVIAIFHWRREILAVTVACHVIDWVLQRQSDPLLHSVSAKSVLISDHLSIVCAQTKPKCPSTVMLRRKINAIDTDAFHTDLSQILTDHQKFCLSFLLCGSFNFVFFLFSYSLQTQNCLWYEVNFALYF